MVKFPLIYITWLQLLFFIPFHTLNLIINSYVVSIIITEYTIAFLSLAQTDIYNGYLHINVAQGIEPFYQLSCIFQKRSLLNLFPYQLNTIFNIKFTIQNYQR